MSFMDTLKAQRHNVRDYGMYIAFVVIVVFFTIATDGLFLTSRNIGNLVNATSYIAVLAVGMTLVIVIRHIDLSVGYFAGTLGAVAAISLKYWGVPVIPTWLEPAVWMIISGRSLFTKSWTAGPSRTSRKNASIFSLLFCMFSWSDR